LNKNKKLIDKTASW